MQKIRIFALAKELNLDSKDLIEVCARLGIILKNSALASISPEEKDKVLDYLKQSSSGGQGAAKAAAVLPVREAAKTFDKPLANIMSARPQPARLQPKSRAADGEDIVDSVAATATIDPPAPVAGETSTSRSTPVARPTEKVDELSSTVASTQATTSVDVVSPIKGGSTATPLGVAPEKSVSTTPASSLPKDMTASGESKRGDPAQTISAKTASSAEAKAAGTAPIVGKSQASSGATENPQAASTRASSEVPGGASSVPVTSPAVRPGTGKPGARTSSSNTDPYGNSMAAPVRPNLVSSKMANLSGKLPVIKPLTGKPGTASAQASNVASTNPQSANLSTSTTGPVAAAPTANSGTGGASTPSVTVEADEGGNVKTGATNSGSQISDAPVLDQPIAAGSGAVDSSSQTFSASEETVEATGNDVVIGSDPLNSSFAGDAAPEQAEESYADDEDAGDNDGGLTTNVPESVSGKTDKPSTPPLRRDEYIAPTGARRPVFNMKPQGTVDMSKAANDAVNAKKGPKTRPGPNLPTLAAMPEFKGPTAAPTPAAQKPDIKLPTGTTINEIRPLQVLLDKHKKEIQDKVTKPTPDGKGVKRKSLIDLVEEIEQAAAKGKAKAGGVKTGAGLEDSRKARQARRGREVGFEDEDESSAAARRFGPKGRAKHKSFIAPAKTKAEIELPISIRSLSECIGRPAKELLKILFMRGVPGVNINSIVDEDTAIELALELGVDLSIRYERDLEQELFEEPTTDGETEELVHRPPIITILGHVDHGKTTLLDTIRSANVAAGEAGGITQHIAAYQVEHKGHKLTFVDTPGHAAFSEMRARGANVTDIVVLVVAADDGVMPQTAEAISHAKAAGVPIVVALNKCDLPGKNEQRVLQDLARHEIMPAEWGGDVEVVRTSGLTGLGVDDLLETLLLTAELHEYKSNPKSAAGGVCLEAFRDEGRGPIAWLMIQRGTLQIGDTVVCGEAVGRIRNMYNDRGEEVESAGPSSPVKVSGLDVVPGPGDKFVVTADGEAARQLADERRIKERAKALAAKVKPRTLEDVLDRAKGGGIRDLPLIVKADSPGSIEALRHELDKFQHPEVRVKLVHDGVGGVNESDIYLATATNAIVIAFHVVPEDRARVLAEREGVEIRQYEIIYEVTDHIKLALEGLLKPELQHVSTGRALVLRTFFISRVGGTIAGCRVLNGTIERTNRIRVIRDHRVLNEYGIGSLKREKDDVKEVREGYECGIRLENFNDVKEGDLFEAYRVEEVKRTLT